jgi:hypothetical protein
MADLQSILGADPEVIRAELDALKSVIELAKLEPVRAARIIFINSGLLRF